MRTSVVTPYAAYLRVYEPLEAFPSAERDRWRAYLDSGEVLSQSDGMVTEQRRGLANLASTPPVAVPVHESGEAYVLTLDGTTYVCPWLTRLRSWQALEAFRRDLPPSFAEACVPRVVLDQAESDFARWRNANGRTASYIETSTWHVPPRWFVAFTGDERSVHVATRTGSRGLVYRTPMVEARRRVARALRVLRSTVIEGPFVLGVENLGRWLEEFHPRSYVELDYGGLVHLMSDEDLAEDRSAADVAEGIACLQRGDGEAAGVAYGRLMRRWRSVRAMEHAN